MRSSIGSREVALISGLVVQRVPFLVAELALTPGLVVVIFSLPDRHHDAATKLRVLLQPLAQFRL